MPDVKKVRKVARCIQTMLEVEGEVVKAKDIMELIKEKDLSDIAALKVEVASHIEKMVDEFPRIRRDVLKDFIIANWEVLEENTVVRDVLFNGYCMGPFSKEKRGRMVDSLVEEIKENKEF